MIIIALPLGVAIGSIKIENWNVEQLCVSTISIFICTLALKYSLFNKEQRSKRIAEYELRQACFLALFSYVIIFGACVILAESYVAFPLAFYMFLLIVSRYVWFTEIDLEKPKNELWGTENALFRKKRTYIISVPMIVVLIYNLMIS